MSNVSRSRYTEQAKFKKPRSAYTRRSIKSSKWASVLATLRRPELPSRHVIKQALSFSPHKIISFAADHSAPILIKYPSTKQNIFLSYYLRTSRDPYLTVVSSHPFQ